MNMIREGIEIAAEIIALFIVSSTIAALAVGLAVLSTTVNWP